MAERQELTGDVIAAGEGQGTPVIRPNQIASTTA
jgi:hypothetical protein